MHKEAVVNTRALSGCLMIILAGCAGTSQRPHDGLVDVHQRSAPVKVLAAAAPSGSIQQGCEEVALSSTLASSAELLLWEIWEKLLLVGASGALLPHAVDAALLIHEQPGLASAQLRCVRVRTSAAGFAQLREQMNADLHRYRDAAEAELVRLDPLPATGASLWSGMDESYAIAPIAASSGNGRVRPGQLLVPVGSGSVFRLSRPHFELHSGVRFEGIQGEDAQQLQTGSSVPDDVLNYRIRLPSGTVRVLIVKF